MKGKKNTKIKNRKVINLLILAIFVAIITAYAISNTRAQETTTEETTENTDKVVWVESTETDEEGNILKVPVPVGYTASQIPGETTVSGGFVIYEGEIDWSKIVIEEEEETTEAESTETETETQSETENEVATASFSLDENAEENKTEEQTDSVDNNTVNQENNEIAENTVAEESNEIVNNVENTIEATSFNLSNNQEETETTENQEETENTATEEETQEIVTYSTDSTETEGTTTLLELQSTVNQYVWVPIYDISEIYGVDENGKIWGKLYNYTSTGRQALNWTEENGVMSITDETTYREPDITKNQTVYDVDSKLQSYLDEFSRYELLSEELEKYYYEIIKSIKEYGGFYIGRYETGNLSGTAVVQKTNTDIANRTWYEMYESCKLLKGEKENVFTYMITGSLWDATFEWFVDSEATNSLGNTITYALVGYDQTTWGNYANTTFEYMTEDGVIETKEINTRIRVPTGSTEYTKVNNIYDMAGNVMDITLEISSNNKSRSSRGSYYGFNGTYISKLVHSRFESYGGVSGGEKYIGCRAVLLIK